MKQTNCKSTLEEGKCDAVCVRLFSFSFEFGILSSCCSGPHSQSVFNSAGKRISIIRVKLRCRLWANSGLKCITVTVQSYLISFKVEFCQIVTAMVSFLRKVETYRTNVSDSSAFFRCSCTEQLTAGLILGFLLFYWHRDAESSHSSASDCQFLPVTELYKDLCLLLQMERTCHVINESTVTFSYM